MRLFNRRVKLPLLSNFPRLSSKAAFLVILIAFLMDYQPSLSIPPIKKGVARAQTEQIQSVAAENLPFEFQLPHLGYITTKFSFYHPGVDLATGLGMPIKTIAPGTVTNTGFNFWGLGLNVAVDHGYGYKSLYAHMGNIYVQKDQSVEKDDILGTVGLTGHTSGPHTHLEISKESHNIDPQTVLPPIREIPVAADFKQVANTEPIAEKADATKPVDFKKELRLSL